MINENIFLTPDSVLSSRSSLIFQRIILLSYSTLKFKLSQQEASLYLLHHGCLAYSLALKMEALCSYKMFGLSELPSITAQRAVHFIYIKFYKKLSNILI